MRAFAVLDAPDCARRKNRAGISRILGEVERYHRSPHKSAFHGGNLTGLEFAYVSGGEVAGDTAHAGTVGPVGGDSHINYGIVKPHRLGKGKAESGVFRKFNDAVVILPQSHFLGRAHHAVAFHPAYLGFLQL